MLLAAALSLSLLLSSCPAGKASAEVRRESTSATAAATTTTTATATTTASTTTTTNPAGALSETAVRPTVSSAHFRRAMAALWRGILSHDSEAAMSPFFPENVYVRLKAISDPALDRRVRLVADCKLDLAGPPTTTSSPARGRLSQAPRGTGGRRRGGLGPSRLLLQLDRLPAGAGRAARLPARRSSSLDRDRLSRLVAGPVLRLPSRCPLALRLLRRARQSRFWGRHLRSRRGRLSDVRPSRLS